MTTRPLGCSWSCVFLTGVSRNNCYLVWDAPSRPCPGRQPASSNGPSPTHPFPFSGPSKMQCHRAVSAPAAGSLGTLCCFLSLPGTSLSARGATGQAEIVGKGEGVVPMATHQHASPFYCPLPPRALCPVVLQGRDLDNVAGYGRNVRVGAWAGRGWPTFSLWG